MLKPTSNARERILVIGGWGSGKTQTWLNISHVYRVTKTPGKFYVFDTELQAERNLEPYKDWDSNIVVDDLLEWDDWTKKLKAARVKATRDDWLVIDMVDRSWNQVQAGFTEKAFGKEIDEWFVSYRRDHPDGGNALAGEYGANWGIIYKMYGSFISELLRWPGHMLCCCAPAQMSDKDDQDLRDAFSRFGIRPGGAPGKNNLGFQFHSILLMGTPKRGTWVMSSMRDRSRELVSRGAVGKFPAGGFVKDYLVKIGGWEL